MTAAQLWKVPDVPVQIGGGLSDAPQASVEQQMNWAFGISTPELKLFTTGLEKRLKPGPAATLGERVQVFFDALAGDAVSGEPAPRLLVGALPFDRNADDCLFLPQRAANRPWPVQSSAPKRLNWRMEPQPDRVAYRAAVAGALAEIRRASVESPLEKVVLSRSLKLTADGWIDPFDLWSALKADPSAARFITPLGQDAGGAMRRLVGASPELLISKQGARILSYPLAGSARRSPDLAEDEAVSKALLRSDKDRREHAAVVEAILDALAPYCSELRAPPGPALVSTRTMWHLGTRIEGRLRHPDRVSSAELAAVLHPTPAVAGAPRERAVELIQQLEGYDRRFYAGAVGWTNAVGDGAWHVSLRCAEVAGDTARLYAGAGIVEGSDPEAEADETSGKFQAVLRALGVDEAAA